MDLQQVTKIMIITQSYRGPMPLMTTSEDSNIPGVSYVRSQITSHESLKYPSVVQQSILYA